MENCVKVVLIGDASVGKTALVKRWIGQDDATKTASTVGASFSKQFVDIDGEVYCINIWDTAGDESFNSLIPVYCRNAVAAFIVFDLTSINTFANIAKWQSLLAESNGNIPYIVIGNKSDLDDKKEVTDDMIQDYTKEHKVQYFETSALTGSMVEEAFNALAILATESIKVHTNKESTNTPLKSLESTNNNIEEEKNKCC